MFKRIRSFFIRLLIIGSGVIILGGNPSHGLDTDLYTVTGLEVPPNVLFIFDNSSSMANEDQAPLYNPDRTNPAPTYSGSYPNNAVYKKSEKDWFLFKNHYNEILCSTVQTSLAVDGIYNGKLKSDTSCDVKGKGSPVFLQTGNYMNYLALTQESKQPRLGLAKGTIHSYVNSTEGIRFGLMVFNSNGQGGRITAPVSDDKNALFSALSDIHTSNLVDWTPLAESLYEAMLYFEGETTHYNSGLPNTNPYTSPIQYRCQKNYVIIITDGAPTHDVADDGSSPIPSVIGDYDADGKDPGTYDLQGSHYLDDVAKYVHLNDLRADLTGRQNITVYTIGFNPCQLCLDSTLLQSAAGNGGGQYHYAHNAQTFKAALQSVIEEILAKSVSYVAPTVPISQMEKTASVDRMYLGMFKPAEKAFWKGNIKKFGIASANDPLKGISIGDILDKNGDLVIDTSTGGIYDSSISYWSTREDGGDVEKGGVGEILKNMTNLYDRKIYTYLGNADLTHSSNRFNTTNITPAMLGLSAEDDKNKLINFMYGYDAYDEDGDKNTTEKRSWILGAIIHSRPLVVHHSTKTVIYAGANDGMLHAFDDSTGAELWAFIPPDLLPKLQNLTGNILEFFVDGTPRVYEGSSQKILIFGERRGGNRYYALDITDPDRPLFLWQINPATMADYSEMGQTWSTPVLGKIKYGTTDSWVDKWVFFIGGGYDTNQDNLPVVSNDSMGRAVYAIDVLNGSLIKKWQFHASDNPYMTYSIPSDIARVDTNLDGRIDRLYAGDTGGQIWRLDLSNPSPSNWTVKRIFNSNDPAPSPGVDRRKIFYPPDVALEKDGTGDYELLMFGTGDREHPKDQTVYNRLYAVKDRNPTSVLKETDLVDVTLDLLQTGTSEQQQQTYNQLISMSGWYIILSTNSGEKCLAPPLLFYRISYYTTFTPQSGSVSDPCFVGEGYARLYALSYLTGNAYFNFDLTNDVDGTTLRASDRSTIIGTAIPSGAIIAVVGGSSATGYIGIGGGIYKAPLKSTKVLVPISWKQRF